MNLGDRVRSRRMQLQLSIVQLSKRSGLSSPFLSQLERGQTRASFESLLKIAEALEVSLSYFEHKPTKLGAVRAPEEFHRFSLAHSEVTYARMGLGDRESQLEPLLITLPPDAKAQSLNHSGEAFFTVVEGRLRMCLEGKEYGLEEGHAVHLKPGTHYTWHNDYPHPTKLIWVGTPQLF